MTLTQLTILSEMQYCIAIANDILRHRGSAEIIHHAKQYAEIETPITGETEAPWLRIAWGDVYLFLGLDEKQIKKNNRIVFTGKNWYQFDPFGCYGGEIVNARSYEDFYKQLQNLTPREAGSAWHKNPNEIPVYKNLA